jgi:hypothetical protein
MNHWSWCTLLGPCRNYIKISESDIVVTWSLGGSGIPIVGSCCLAMASEDIEDLVHAYGVKYKVCEWHYNYM